MGTNSNDTKLTDKQKKFCEEYVIDFNGTQAAIRAGYSKKTAQEQSARLLSNVIISEYVKKLQDKLSKKSEITAEMVLNELAKIAFSNVQDLIVKGYTLEEIQELKREHAAAIKSVKYKVTHGESPSTEIGFEVYDKRAALEAIGKHLGFFEVDNKQKSINIKPTIINWAEENNDADASNNKTVSKTKGSKKNRR